MSLEYTGERQVHTALCDIDLDHRERYQFAASLISENMNIADLGCGIGYGANYLSKATKCKSVVAVDVDSEAIEYAKSYYSDEKISFIARNLLDQPIEEKFDVITIFEVLEHIENAEDFLREAKKMLKPTGFIICSTPNENVINYNPSIYKFHKKHYTPDEFKELIISAGLNVNFCGSQNQGFIYAFPGNAMNVFICSQEEQIYLKNVNKNCVMDTAIGRQMAFYERTNWMTQNVDNASLNYFEQDYQHSIFNKEEIRQQVVENIYNYRSIYRPEINKGNINFTEHTEWLTCKDIISQIVRPSINGLCGVALLLGVDKNNRNPTINISIRDDDGFNYSIKKINVKNDEYTYIEFPVQQKSADKNYYIDIKSNDDTRIAVYGTPTGNNMKLNGVEANIEMTYKIYYS